MLRSPRSCTHGLHPCALHPYTSDPAPQNPAAPTQLCTPQNCTSGLSTPSLLTPSPSPRPQPLSPVLELLGAGRTLLPLSVSAGGTEVIKGAVPGPPPPLPDTPPGPFPHPSAPPTRAHSQHPDLRSIHDSPSRTASRHPRTAPTAPPSHSTPALSAPPPCDPPSAPTGPRAGCCLLGVPRGTGCRALLLSLPLPGPGAVPGCLGGGKPRSGGVGHVPALVSPQSRGREGAWHGGEPRGRAGGPLGRADGVTSPGQDLAQPVAGDS